MRIFCPWILSIVLSGFGAIVCRRRLPSLRLLAPYLAFVSVAGMVELACWLKPVAHLNTLFWAVEITHNTLLIFVALELVSQVLPSRFVVPWSTGFISFLVVEIARHWPETSTAALLNLSVSITCTAALLLLALAFVDIEWPEGYSCVTMGLAAVILGEMLPSMAWSQGHLAAWAFQWLPLPGLAILAYVEPTPWRMGDFYHQNRLRKRPGC